MKNDITEAFKDIGATLCMLQTLEEVMSFCVTALCCNNGKTASDIHAMDAKHRKATLGQLVHAMKKQIEIDSDFVEVLNRFIEKRNLFVHRRFLHADYHLLLSEKAPKNVAIFIEDLQSDYLLVKGVFTRYMAEIVSCVSPNFTEEHSKIDGLLNLFYAESKNPLNVRFTAEQGS